MFDQHQVIFKTFHQPSFNSTIISSSIKKKIQIHSNKRKSNCLINIKPFLKIVTLSNHFQFKSANQTLDQHQVVFQTQSKVFHNLFSNKSDEKGLIGPKPLPSPSIWILAIKFTIQILVFQTKTK